MTNYRFKRNLNSILCMLGAFVVGLLLSSIIGSQRCASDEADLVDENSYLLVVLILSAPKNFEQRNAIRETWLNLRPRIINSSHYQNELIYVPTLKPDGFLEMESVDMQKKLMQKYQSWTKVKVANVKVPNFKIKHLFAIGTENLDKAALNDVQTEQNVYTDMLLLNDLHDSYQNLTSKVIKSFRKVLKIVPNFKYVLKSDDDTYAKLDLVSQDLLNYDRKVQRLKKEGLAARNMELYWGYFNGRARIKKKGQWQENNYNLCDRYLPYALGGGYVLSKNLVNYIAEYGDSFGTYISEDISVGTWLAPFKNIHKRHDRRFDTAYMPRECRDYHFVLHKRTIKDMQKINNGENCFSEVNYDTSQNRRPTEYYYDWKQSTLNCCDNRV